MTSLGFENYAEALKIYLSKYREVSHSILTPIERVLSLHTPPALYDTPLGPVLLKIVY